MQRPTVAAAKPTKRTGNIQKAIADYRKALAASGEGNIHQQAHAYSRSRLSVLGAGLTAPGSTATAGDTSTTTTASANTKSEERAATKAAPVEVNLGRRVALIIGNAAYQAHGSA